MNDPHEAEFGQKLMGVLRRITDPGAKRVDDNYLEKLLSSLRSECDSDANHDTYLMVPHMFHWLSEVVQTWSLHSPTPSTAAFIIQFLGIVTRKENGFKAALEKNVLNEIVKDLNSSFSDHSHLKIAYIRLLCDLISHKSGLQWLCSSQQWKMIMDWLLSNYNFYTEQEGLAFFKKLLCEIDPRDGLLDDIFHAIISSLGEMEEPMLADESYCLRLTTALKLLIAILRVFLLQNPQVVEEKLSNLFNVETKMKWILNKCDNEETLEMASCLYALYFVMKFEDKSLLPGLDSVPESLLEIFNVLLQRNQIPNLIKLLKFCQLLWAEMENKLDRQSAIGMHFIILQFIPMCALKRDLESKMFDSYVQKLFALTNRSSQKFGFAFRDQLKKKPEMKKWTLKSILSVSGNTDSLKQDEAVLIFQFLAYALIYFIPKNTDQDRRSTESLQNFYSTSTNGTCLDPEDVSLLSATLNSLCLFIEKFKINWVESLESLCLLKVACDLLDNGNLSCILVVQTLSLIRLAILNSMSPNLALLLNKPEDSSFECLLPLLYKHLHNPSWEIRDSCIEVLTTVLELAESKYPSLKEVLLRRDFFSLVYGIMEGDSESYVRASAIRALAAMTRMKCFQCRIRDVDLPSKIINFLRGESEGIVRREAVLLLKEFYLSLELTPEVMESFYHIMNYAATSDLHWEVKVNALAFWEAVIQRNFANQGMIDGSFPKVTFSKEHKKIVTMTGDEIKARLSKALEELSRIGCLHVLVSTVQEDCDYQVVKKSAEILGMLLNVFKQFGMLNGDEVRDVCDRIPSKRKHDEEFQDSTKEERKSICKVTRENVDVENNGQTLTVGAETDSDVVIEQIVNEMDINLLVSVHRNQVNGEKSPTRVVPVEQIKPEVFLMQMRNFESNSFLKRKKKWLINDSTDLRSLVNDIMMVDNIIDTNVMDCY